MSRLRSYKSKMMVLSVAAFGVAVLAAFLAGQLLNLQTSNSNFWLFYLPTLALCAFAFGALTPWWRKLDDVQRSGQYVAWFWGGQAGGMAILMALVVAAGRTSDLALGGLAVFMGEAVGFLAVWLAWRWQSRGPAE
jgi:hypothetical protein